jgi:hypothetical protein
MPFGISTVPASFHRAISKILFDLIGQNLAIYLENIISRLPLIKRTSNCKGKHGPNC